MFRKTPHRRRIAGLVAGALAAGSAVVGVLAVPGSAAAADPSTELTQTADLRCTYSSYGTTYAGTITTTVGGAGAITMTMSDIPAFGMPAILTIDKITSTVTATIDGEAVSLTGQTPYDPWRNASLDIPVPTSTVTRTGTGPISTVVISKLVIGMSVHANGGANAIPATMNCLPAVHTTTALTVDTSESKKATLTAAVTPSTATGTVKFFEGSVQVGTTQTLAGGAASVTLTGVSGGSHSYTASYIPANGTAFVPSSSDALGGTVGDVTQTADLRCTYSTYGTTYTGKIKTVANGTSVSMTMADLPAFGMPAILSVDKITSTVTATIDGEAVSLTGQTLYDPWRNASLDIPIPASTVTRTGTDPISAVAISKLVIGMSVHANGGANAIPATMNCLPAVHTTTALSVATPQPKAATLTATVTPSTATGTVKFFEGANQVGATQTLVNGVAAVDLTNVSVGDHSYVAKYTPANGSAFVSSETAEVAGSVVDEVNGVTDLRCTYSSYGTTYAGAVTTTIGDEGAISMEMADIPAFGMPSILSLDKITSTVTAKVDGEAVSLTGQTLYDPWRNASLDIPIPTASGTRTGTGDATTVTISKIVLGMSVHANGGANAIPATMNCVTAVHTQLSLGVSTTQPKAATLTATIAPSDAAGTVKFYEGANQVGTTQTLADGTASVSLTGVSVGAHTYKATYVPANGSAFVPSEATPIDATVIDNPPAVPDGLGYTCTLVFGGTYHYDSGLDIDVTVPETVTAGDDFAADIDMTLDMGNQSMGPVASLAGSVDLDLTVGGTPTTVTIPVSTATVPEGQTKLALQFSGSKQVNLAAPDAPGSADVEVGDVEADLVSDEGVGSMPVSIPCVPDEEQDQKVASTTVEAPTVVPDGLEYKCVYGSWNFPAYIDTTATLPASVKQGATLNPSVSTTVTWVNDLTTIDWTAGIAGDWRSWPATSRSTHADYNNGTAVLTNSANGTSVAGSLAFGSTPVTESGDMVWTATGSFGAVNTSTPGVKALSVGRVHMTVGTKNDFTGDDHLPSEIDCTLIPGQETALGSVDVEAVPSIGLSGAKVTGTNKVGQKLTASATSAPADAAKAYQWLRNGVAIGGATAATYTVVPADLAKTLSVRVTATKSGFQSATATVAAGKVGAGTQKVTGKAKATGTAKVGKKLTATPGKAAGATVKYQWLVNGKAISKATGKTLKLAKAFKGKKVSVKVSYVRTGYTTVTQTSSALKIKK